MGRAQNFCRARMAVVIASMVGLMTLLSPVLDVAAYGLPFTESIPHHPTKSHSPPAPTSVHHCDIWSNPLSCAPAVALLFTPLILPLEVENPPHLVSLPVFPPFHPPQAA